LRAAKGGRTAKAAGTQQLYVARVWVPYAA
jgi:hypothetical protein